VSHPLSHLLRKRFTEQVKQEEARFRHWEQHARISASFRISLTDGCRSAERDRLNKDLELAYMHVPSTSSSSKPSSIISRWWWHRKAVIPTNRAHRPLPWTSFWA